MKTIGGAVGDAATELLKGAAIGALRGAVIGAVDAGAKAAGVGGEIKAEAEKIKTAGSAAKPKSSGSSGKSSTNKKAKSGK